MKSWETLWRDLPEETRIKAAEVFWQGARRGDFAHQVALDFLSHRLRARPGYVEKKLPEGKRVQLLARAMDLPEPVIGMALLLLHLGRRPYMLRRFLEIVGLPHDNGRILREAFQGSPPDAALLEKGITRIFAEFDPDEVRLYLDVLELDGTGLWGDLPAAREAVEARRAAGGATEAAASPGASPDAGDEEEAPLPPFARDPQSNLDHLVVDAIVASVAGAEGCLEEDQLDALLDEVLGMNPRRHSSWFHRGFADVLRGREPDPSSPESNELRRGWYLCGAMAGLARRKDQVRIVRLLEEYPEDARPLGSGIGDLGEAAHLAAPILFEALLEVKGPSAAAEWVRPGGVALAGPFLFARILSVASDLLRDLRPEEAGLLLDLLQDSTGVFEKFGTPPPPETLRDVRRRQAHRARLLGDHGKARSLLESLLEDGPGERHGMIAADLGLIACGYRSLGEVRLPADPVDFPETVRTLEKGREWFEESASVAGEGGHGEFCLGVLRLAAGDVKGALPMLSRAVPQMERRPEVYGSIPVLARARLYQARCLAATLDRGHAAHAAEKLVLGARALPAEARPLVRETLLDIASCDQEAAARAAPALVPVLGDALLDAALESDLLPGMPGLREALLRRAEDPRRPPPRRFDDYESLLRVARTMGDLERARGCLDGLEGLAEAGGAERHRLLAKLVDEEFFRPAWDPEDAALVRVRALESDGKVLEAAGILTALAHQALTRGGASADAEARGLVERIRALGVGEPDEALLRRMAAAPAAPPSAGADPATVRGTVLLIGGNETQERYREDLLRWAGETWPRVTLLVEFPGWGSNWGRELERYGNLVRKADAVVVLKFIRTLLGHHLRRMCGEAGVPWVPCTGHGRDSLRGAITTAVDLLREGNPRD